MSQNGIEGNRERIKIVLINFYIERRIVFYFSYKVYELKNINDLKKRQFETLLINSLVCHLECVFPMTNISKEKVGKTNSYKNFQYYSSVEKKKKMNGTTKQKSEGKLVESLTHWGLPGSFVVQIFRRHCPTFKKQNKNKKNFCINYDRKIRYVLITSEKKEEIVLIDEIYVLFDQWNQILSISSQNIYHYL
ncbi:hypothetical protein RFI_35068 [Reticulomyxa filosa]|uniref:Uncharacterized protein n=1 Tax=Reticulomyxa filosa TaxID=46433 RepID=X6LLA5_RETFI|nr:hypothetical protein RFI_35068 [Reticulomyxa filosa]|eukprot:ETO02369.1 hypothetical protein RFI_35068 [Reticulomyxa filosa]